MEGRVDEFLDDAEVFGRPTEAVTDLPFRRTGYCAVEGVGGQLGGRPCSWTPSGAASGLATGPLRSFRSMSFVASQDAVLLTKVAHAISFENSPIWSGRRTAPSSTHFSYAGLGSGPALPSSDSVSTGTNGARHRRLNSIMSASNRTASSKDWPAWGLMEYDVMRSASG